MLGYSHKAGQGSAAVHPGARRGMGDGVLIQAAPLKRLSLIGSESISAPREASSFHPGAGTSVPELNRLGPHPNSLHSQLNFAGACLRAWTSRIRRHTCASKQPNCYASPTQRGRLKPLASYSASPSNSWQWRGNLNSCAEVSALRSGDPVTSIGRVRLPSHRGAHPCCREAQLDTRHGMGLAG